MEELLSNVRGVHGPNGPRPSCTDQGIYPLHTTPEVGHPFGGIRRGLLARQARKGINANHDWSSKHVCKASMVFYHGVAGQAATEHWRPERVTPTGADPDDDTVANISAQWREHCRQTTPERISLDLGTLRKNRKLMQQLHLIATRYGPVRESVKLDVVATDAHIEVHSETPTS